MHQKSGQAKHRYGWVCVTPGSEAIANYLVSISRLSRKTTADVPLMPVWMGII
jgi:hypothetical protein